MNISDAMTKNPISVRRDASLAEAARIMLDNRISGLPVLDAAGELVGVLTEGDLMRRSETDTARHHSRWAELFLSPGHLAAEFVRANARRVDEVMSSAISIDEKMSLETAISEMERHRIKRLPVTRAGKLCGILSRSDLMRAFLQRQPKTGDECAQSDARIAAAVQEAIDKNPWAPGWTVHVAVKNGDVELSGCVTDENVRNALRVAIENVPGVRNIDDETITIEPMTGAIVRLPSDQPTEPEEPS